MASSRGDDPEKGSRDASGRARCPGRKLRNVASLAGVGVVTSALLVGCGSATASKTPTIVMPSSTVSPAATSPDGGASAAESTQASPEASVTSSAPAGGEVPVDPNALSSAAPAATGGQEPTAEDLPVPAQTALLRSETSNGVRKSYYNSQLSPQEVVQQYIAILGNAGWAITSTSEGGWGPGGTGLSATKGQDFLIVVSGTEGNPTFVNACVGLSRAAAREACT